ncbi:MAG: porin family protein [Bacteroidota bacterium]
MKKLILVAALAAITFGAQAQGEMRIGLKGAFNYTALFNNNVSDQGYELDYAPTTGGSFGASFNYRLADNYSLDVNLLISGHNEKYDLKFGPEASALPATVETKLKYIDIPVLFKLGNGHGAYFEVGPQLSFLSSAKETFDYPSATSLNYTDKNFKNDFSGFGLSGVLGFGADFELNDQLGLTAGLRLGYMFTDATTEYTENEYDKLYIDENVSANAIFNHNTTFLGLGAKNVFDYQKTTRAWAGLNIGLTYKLK